MAALVGVVAFSLLIDLAWIVLAINTSRDAFKCGMLCAYISYDLVHYYLHHGDPSWGYFKRLRAIHMHHHFKNHETGLTRFPFAQLSHHLTSSSLAGLGISSSLWDYVLGTLPPAAEVAVYYK